MASHGRLLTPYDRTFHSHKAIFFPGDVYFFGASFAYYDKTFHYMDGWVDGYQGTTGTSIAC